MSDNSTVVAAVLEAAAGLIPTPGYINGDDYDQWYVEARPSLLLALSELARVQGAHPLAERLDRLSHPLCMEPVDAVLTPGTMPKMWCLRPVESAGAPCSLHTPERAADLGRCTWSGERALRICRKKLRSGDDRCDHHAAYCRSVKVNGEVCNRYHCNVPKHRASSRPETS